jgi:excisionase family DNA binding protein
MAGEVFKKQTTVWRLNGRRVPPGTPGAEKDTLESRKWYGTVNGRQVPLCRDKQAAERMLTKRLADAALADVGLADPFLKGKAMPLVDHLVDYRIALEGKGDTSRHVDLTVSRIRALLDGCGFTVFADVDPVIASEWLTARRRDGCAVFLPPGDSFTPAETARLFNCSLANVRSLVKRHGLAATGQGKARRFPRATVEALADRAGRGAGPETINHYIRSARGFFRWLVRTKRLPSNPTDTLDFLDAQTDVRRARRELTAAELRDLLAAAHASQQNFRGLDGAARFHLYATGCATGFRASGLASLTPDSFDLGGCPRINGHFSLALE